MTDIKRLPPHHFAHVLDLTTNITFVEEGPQCLVLKTNERLVCGPCPCVVVPPACYCVIKNPCKNYEKGKPLELRHGHFDVRFHEEPFVLYPGEELVGAPEFTVSSKTYSGAVKPLPVVSPHCALRLEARVDHKDGDMMRRAGDVWHVEGPITYRPTAHAEIVEQVEPHIVKPNEALRLVALQDCVDKSGRARVTGEEWLVTEEGAYLPGVFERVVEVEEAFTLTRDLALHLRATQHVTFMGRKRQPGDEWLVTAEQVESLIPPIGVEKVVAVKRAVLRKSQFCVVLNPVDKEGRPQLGQKEVRTGISDFFLHPGESLEKGIQSAYILAENESVTLQAVDSFIDTSLDKPRQREAGEKWMISGPLDYTPPVQVKVIDRRKAIPLSKNEGVYVRDIKTGRVRAVMGPQSYMLTAQEVLWEKELPALVETLLKQGGGAGSGDIRKIAYFDQSIDPAILKGRDKTRLVNYRCPGNTACQVYNYMNKTARVVFGPDLVILGPHENFMVLSLSAGKPKVPNAMKSLALMLGPDFITDITVVETSDHARLQVKIAFNNHFEFDPSDEQSASKLFSVPDFIGYSCSQLASKIRGAVAAVTFDEFHRHSAKIIQHAVFGTEKDGSPGQRLKFEANNLMSGLMVISSIDVQSIEPVDTRMRDSLMKSVQMAIEISTNSIEAAASHEAARLEQAARGKLDRQKLVNEKEAEKQRTRLNELRAVTAAVESTGQAVAEAQAQAEKVKIECQSEIEAARLKAEATEIEYKSELEAQNKLRAAELKYQREQSELEVSSAQAYAELEVSKFTKTVSTMGRETLAAIATAGPDTQLKMLKALGIQSVLLTDGNNPINLFNTTQGLVGGPAK